MVTMTTPTVRCDRVLFGDGYGVHHALAECVVAHIAGNSTEYTKLGARSEQERDVRVHLAYGECERQNVHASHLVEPDVRFGPLDPIGRAQVWQGDVQPASKHAVRSKRVHLVVQRLYLFVEQAGPNDLHEGHAGVVLDVV